MNSRHYSLVLASLCSLLLATFCQAQEISLFNGRDLTGWAGLPQYWSVKDGAITGKVTSKNGSKGNTFLVWQGGEVADFDLTLQYRLVPDNPERLCDSGIQFRSQLGDASRFGLKGYQANLDPGTSPSGEVWKHAGGFNGCLMDDPPGLVLAYPGQKTLVHPESPGMPRKNGPQPNVEQVGSLGADIAYRKLQRANEWNECRVIAVGNHFQVFINGQSTVDVTDEVKRYNSGLIGLQIHNPMVPKMVQFKDIKLRVLSGSQPVQQLPTASTAALTIDPNQPLLDTFSQLAPNASAWVLAGLDEGVPPNVRQNLTYLREDLLDEYKQKPKASQEAYKLAHQLCSTMITALDERDQTLVNAGFRAAQADAGIRGTNQALEARRNYMMSWPQYAREQAQRAELIRQGTAGAQVSRELPKVEWSTRTAAMRKTIDDLYAQFREALRQSSAVK
jgi:hypothetical protein